MKDARHELRHPFSPPLPVFHGPGGNTPITPQCVEAAHYLQPYLDEYYDCLTIENLEIGTFLIEATRPPTGKVYASSLDVGCGPTLLYWGLFMHPCVTHHGIDVLPTNLEAVKAEINSARNGVVHRRYQEICDYFGDAGDPIRFLNLCERVGRLEAVDASGIWPFATGDINVVTMLFSIEVLPTTEALERSLMEAKRVLSDGGRLVLVSLCDTLSWKIGEYTGRCLCLDSELLFLSLERAGFTDVVVERKMAVTASSKGQGYQWMLFVKANAGNSQGNRIWEAPPSALPGANLLKRLPNMVKKVL